MLKHSHPLLFVVWIVLLLCHPLTSVAQQNRAVPTSTVSYGSGGLIEYTTLPSGIRTLTNVQTSPATDPNDPVHPCRVGGADAGGFSVFTRIIHPGGILLVNTNFAGTNYNTVVSVFRASGSGLFASPRVKRVTLSAVLGAGTGTLSVSELYTWYQRNLVVARDAAPLPLPMPSAP